MKRYFFAFVLTFAILLGFALGPATSLAATQTYTVQPNDTMWKIAVKNQVGVSEIISANPQIQNPNLIYPGQRLNIPVNSTAAAIEKEVARQVNAQRSRYGLPALSYNWQLARMARIKSQDMINKNYFSHTSPTYGSPFDMMRSFGISYMAAGENIAMGQRNATEVMNAWMNSSGHRANILNSNFTQIGVGYAVDSNGRPYWTQEFIGQ
jgi:uncharacterized YkwD family protein/spore coat assembly protein SafA